MEIAHIKIENDEDEQNSRPADVLSYLHEIDFLSVIDKPQQKRKRNAISNNSGHDYTMEIAHFKIENDEDQQNAFACRSAVLLG